MQKIILQIFYKVEPVFDLSLIQIRDGQTHTDMDIITRSTNILKK